MIEFSTIEYLKAGTPRQQLAYHELMELAVFDQLKDYHPILTGTIPIDIDVPQSDLDIICECADHQVFSNLLSKLFGDRSDFEIRSFEVNGILSTVSNFVGKEFEIEIFGQNIPSNEQNAYRHMRIEHAILEKEGEAFKSQIRELKMQGMKTEPAFAYLLKLKGDPYKALLNLEF